MRTMILTIVIFIIGCTGQEPVSTGIDDQSFTGEVSQDLTSDANLIPDLDLMQHNTLDDCWVAYDGIVYDITGYIQKHPGSAGTMLRYCGTSDDFGNAFTVKHGTSKIDVLVYECVVMGDLTD